MRTHLIHRPARDIIPHWVDLECSPITFDTSWLSCCCRSLFSGPTELGAVDPDAVHDHSQSAGQVAFVSYGENTIPAGLVEFDEVVEVPGHRGRYGVLLASFGSDSVAWEQSNGLVVVYVTETLPEDLSFLRCSHTSATAIETHATYRVSEIA